MQLLHHLEELDEACRGGVCMTLGVFDAVHRGHRYLISRTIEEARRRKLRSMVFTFERHPLALLAPVHCPPSLSQPAEKRQLIEAMEVDICLMLRFTPEIAAIEARRFIREVLVGRCGVKFIVCGWNFSFGQGGKGNTELLQEESRAGGYVAEIAEPLMEGASPISSSRVRNVLIEGRVQEGASLLGRPYSFAATVVTGDGRGRTIGFPTANLQPAADQLVPAEGVYATLVNVEGTKYGGMMNIGHRPTFEGAGRSMEVHLFDFSGDLVGKEITIEFVERIRDEQKFPSVDALIEQLRRDEADSRKATLPFLSQ